MYTIGLTGGIASGKSTVCAILKEEFDAFIIDADKLSREITARGTPAYGDIVKIFGQCILTPEKEIDRKKLGDIVFQNQVARKELEKITHFRIWDEIQKLLQDASSKNLQIAILDIPLLIESGWQDRVDEVWLVYLDSHSQIERLMKRDGLSWQEAAARIDSQLPLSEKKKYANVIIDNSYGLENTKEQVIFHYRAIYLSNGCRHEF